MTNPDNVVVPRDQARVMQEQVNWPIQLTGGVTIESDLNELQISSLNIQTRQVREL